MTIPLMIEDIKEILVPYFKEMITYVPKTYSRLGLLLFNNFSVHKES